MPHRVIPIDKYVPGDGAVGAVHPPGKLFTGSFFGRHAWSNSHIVLTGPKPLDLEAEPILPEKWLHALSLATVGDNPKEQATPICVHNAYVWFAEGCVIAVAYYDAAVTRWPNCTFHWDGKTAGVWIRHQGQPAGIIMRIRIKDDDWPGCVKALLPAKGPA